MKKIKNVFIGPYDISSQANDFTKGFNALGVNVYFIRNSDVENPLQASVPYLDIFKLKNRIPYFKPRRISTRLRKYWLKLVDWYVYYKIERKCDLFIYVWSTLENDFSDLERLRKKNIKIVFFFVGDDVRWYDAMQQEFEKFGLPPIEYENAQVKALDYLKLRLSFLRNAEKEADLIFSHPNQSQLALRPYHRGYVMIDMERFAFNPIQREKKPVVIHAPSSYAGKGTRFVLEAVERLKAEGVDFEFILLQGIPYTEIVAHYDQADILVGQLLSPGGGKQERELMAMGKVVLTSVGYKYDSAINPNECPMIDISPANVYEELKAIIPDYRRRCELSLKGRQYVEKYHKPEAFCKRVLDLAEQKEEQRQYDYHPSFFREEFLAGTQEKADAYNSWTEFVKNCTWYKTYVPAGTRELLKF